MVFGKPHLFALVVAPLEGPPPEADVSAALTWAALEIWVGGRNLSAHTHTDDQSVHKALHWPTIYLARWIVRSWSSLFERQIWPLPEHERNAREMCEELDDRVFEDIDSDVLLDERDEFVMHHSLLAAAAGGIVPDLYFAHDGARVSVAWDSPPEFEAVRFHHSRDELDVPTPLFVDAVRGFVGWVAEALSRSDAPQAVSERAEFVRWLEYLDSPEAAHANLAGFIGITAGGLAEFLGDEPVDSVFALPRNWVGSGSLFDASGSWPAVVFRAVRADLAPHDVHLLLERLAQIPRSEAGRQRIERFRARVPTPTGRTDYDQGYSAAEAVRETIRNRDRNLDVESLVREELQISVIEDIQLQSSEIDGGSVWDEERGPAIFLNSNSKRAGVEWGRRMILAHELFHLLFDIRAAIPLTVVSGPWAPPVVERRANAFAAELILPLLGIRRLIPHRISRLTTQECQTLMDEFKVGDTACRRHVENRLRLKPRY
jgi:Zn-dependent peptidase ImmA (M78 family)